MRRVKESLALTAVATLGVDAAAVLLATGGSVEAAPTVVNCKASANVAPGTVNALAGSIIKMYAEVPPAERTEQDTKPTPTERASVTKTVILGNVAMLSEASVTYRVVRTADGRPAKFGLLQSVVVANTSGTTRTVDTFTPNLSTLSWQVQEVVYGSVGPHIIARPCDSEADHAAFEQILGGATNGLEAAFIGDPQAYFYGRIASASSEN